MLRLDDLIGKKIELAIVDSEKPIYSVTLHGVENGGLWVESFEIENLAFVVSAASRAQRQRKPVFFLPYARIQYVIAYSTELDERSFLP